MTIIEWENEVVRTPFGFRPCGRKDSAYARAIWDRQYIGGHPHSSVHYEVNMSVPIYCPSPFTGLPKSIQAHSSDDQAMHELQCWSSSNTDVHQVQEFYNWSTTHTNTTPSTTKYSGVHEMIRWQGCEQKSRGSWELQSILVVSTDKKRAATIPLPTVLAKP